MTKRIPSLEGVRGLAFLTVHVFHSFAFGPFLGSVPGGGLYAYGAQLGWIGVDLFFVLSGFLITGILLRTKDEAGWAGRYYLRRALRIMPAYFIVLLGTLYALPALMTSLEPIAQVPKENLGWYATFTHNLLNLRYDGWPPGDELVGQLWSLAVEEQFYLFWPFAVFFLDLRKLRWLAAALIVTAPLSRLLLGSLGLSYEATYTFPLCRADALAGGALLAILAQTGRLPTRTFGWGIFAVGAVLFLATPRLAGHFDATLALHLRNAAISWGVLMWCGLLVVALRPGRVADVLSLRPLRFVGFYSYTLYLVTYPLCYVAGLLWKEHLPAVAGIGQIAFYAVTLGIGLGVSWLSWHLVEKRFLSLSGSVPEFR